MDQKKNTQKLTLNMGLTYTVHLILISVYFLKKL